MSYFLTSSLTTYILDSALTTKVRQLGVAICDENTRLALYIVDAAILSDASSDKMRWNTGVLMVGVDVLSLALSARTTCNVGSAMLA